MPRGSRLTRITIVEDHGLFAEALDVALTLEGHEVHRVGVDSITGGAERLLATILSSRPRVVLLDLHLGPLTHAGGLIRPLAQAGVAVVVVTGSTDKAEWGECVFNGARTVIPKSTPLNAILSAIRHLREDQPVMALAEREALLAEFHRQRTLKNEGRTRMATLSVREREILHELMHGRQVREIAHDHVVSEATVRTQVKSILAKLGVSSQLGAVGVALRSQRRDEDHRHQV